MTITNEICEECDTLTVDGSDPVFEFTPYLEKITIRFVPHKCA
jgi:hypothetical protein